MAQKCRKSKPGKVGATLVGALQAGGWRHSDFANCCVITAAVGLLSAEQVERREFVRLLRFFQICGSGVVCGRIFRRRGCCYAASFYLIFVITFLV